MADTGAPWNLPYPLPTDLVRDGAQAIQDLAEATADGLDATGFDSIAVITATDTSWPVPSLTSSVVRVTVIGAGGGGGGGEGAGGVRSNPGGSGGATEFGVGAAFSVIAAGGAGGTRAANATPPAGPDGLRSANGGMGGSSGTEPESRGPGLTGYGGEIKIAYIDLSEVSTVNVSIGAGGSGGAGAGSGANTGAAGGRGEVIVEYKAAA